MILGEGGPAIRPQMAKNIASRMHAPSLWRVERLRRVEVSGAAIAPRPLSRQEKLLGFFRGFFSAFFFQRFGRLFLGFFLLLHAFSHG